ncbi:carboxypeptidase [Cellulomonas chitinilytica]|uniref:Carboxypeptidase n=1 Tax=Cellulomonas chitinilytica TaxID=398759 RepID=A0A919P209_9CELL|nr:transglycosylase domain-containing protein [Cellulomonas chitinilytica]GIG20687.1 carboxypeptidase [Cellulomonas chitinilytica]
MAGTNPRRAAPARSRRSTRTRPSSTTPAAAAGRKRRFFDYPRSGYHGLHRWLPSWRVTLGAFIGMFFLGAGAAAAAYASVTVPDSADADVKAQTSTVYYANKADGSPGAVMGTFQIQNRQLVDYVTLPKYVGQSVAAAEDKTFFENQGVDLKGMARALWYNLHKEAGARDQGGSTLTQQYVERYFVDKTTTDYVGKAKEAILAVKVTRDKSKDEILEGYLNTIYWGRDAYGIQAAAQAYFKVDAKDLTVSQAAMLAGIIPSPNNWDPAVNPDKTKARWDIVLDSMVTQGWLSAADRAAAVFPETYPYEKPNNMTGPNGFLLQMVLDELAKPPLSLSRDQLNRGGYTITTTIQPELQQMAVDTAAGFRAGTLEGQREATPSLRTRYSITSIDPHTGAIVALYGGDNQPGAPDPAVPLGDQYAIDQYNRAATDKIQAGSTFKPFTLIGALSNGVPLSATFDGHSPQVLKGWDSDDGKVSNFDGEQEGTIDLVKATADSVNTVYAQLNLQIGAATTSKTATAAGITTPVRDNAANVLGTDAVHPLDMASAYATIANKGTHITPHIVAIVKNPGGTTALQADTTGKQVFSPDVIADATYAMQQVVQSGSGKDWIKPLDRPIAGKTGTSSSNKSAWFVGFTPDIATAVSMMQVGEDGQAQNSIEKFGKTRGGSTVKEVTGGTWPAFLWQSYMKQAFTLPQYAQVVEFPPRANVNKGATASATPTETPTEQPTEQATEQAPQNVAVPNLDGKLEADATATLVGLGLSANVASEPSDTVTSGRVIRIDPKAGTQVLRGSAVTIVVSTGPKAQPTQPPPNPSPTPTAAGNGNGNNP